MLKEMGVLLMGVALGFFIYSGIWFAVRANTDLEHLKGVTASLLDRVTALEKSAVCTSSDMLKSLSEKISIIDVAQDAMIVQMGAQTAMIDAHSQMLLYLVEERAGGKMNEVH